MKKKVKHPVKTKAIQCKYCINVLTSEQKYARHILTRHPEHIEDYITGEYERILL